jgi:hypothetical protein
MSYTDDKGKKHRNCHSSKKKAQAQISAIEMDEGWRPLAVKITEMLEEELAELAGEILNQAPKNL